MKLKKVLVLRGHFDELHHLYVWEIRNCVQKMFRYLLNDNPNADELKQNYEKMIENALKIWRNVTKTILCVKHETYFIMQILLKMDQNPYLLGFKNGVIDFKEKRFRQGYPEDYITKSTKMDYMPKEKIKNYETKKKKLNITWKHCFPLKNYEITCGIILHQH